MDHLTLLDLIIQNLEEGIIVTDENMVVTYFKDSQKYTGGFDFGDISGKHIFEVFPGLNKHDSTFYYVVTNKKSLRNHVQTYQNHRGKKVSILSSTFPLFDGQRFAGAVEIFQDLTSVLHLADKVRAATREPRRLIHKNGTIYQLGDLVGQSPAIQRIKTQVEEIGHSRSNVLVYGETGTGKEVLVQSIHNQNPATAAGPFVAQNCAAIPHSLLESTLFGTTAGSYTGAKDTPGLVELANGGTLFLDEISSMDPELQSRLLRVIQENRVRRLGSGKEIQVNARFIAATNRPPRELLATGQLRSDLYYRLNVIYLELPPLRERKEDILPISAFVIEKLNRKMVKNITGLSPEVEARFLEYHWPGNVRELENAVESAMNFARDGESIQLSHLQTGSGILSSHESVFPAPAAGALVMDLNQAVAGYERQLLVDALARHGGNAAKAAKALSLPKQTMYNKMAKYGIDKMGFKPQKQDSSQFRD